MGIIVTIIIFLAFSISVFGLLGEGHIWYNTSQSGNQIPCEKCHSNIEAEFDLMPSQGPHKDKTCAYCHRSDIGLGDHAATIPSCQMCHLVDTTNITSINETHKPFYEKSNSNEACIACHTGFDKGLNFTRPLYIEYDIANVNGNWGVQNFDFVSSNTTHLGLKPSGHKHTWTQIENVSCFDCHSDVKNAIENGGHVPRSGYTSSMSADGGHEGRRHNFDRSNVTIDSCRSCHLPDPSNFGSGYTHEGHAQLDYHAATTEHCYNCHYNATPGDHHNGGGMGGGGGGMCGTCHQKLKSGNHDQVLNSMFSQSFCQYKVDKVCIGCHGSGYPTTPESFGNKTFKVYTEPNVTIIIT